MVHLPLASSPTSAPLSHSFPIMIMIDDAVVVVVILSVVYIILIVVVILSVVYIIDRCYFTILCQHKTWFGGDGLAHSVTVLIVTEILVI